MPSGSKPPRRTPPGESERDTYAVPHSLAANTDRTAKVEACQTLPLNITLTETAPQ